ncbi:Dehydrogenase/reductase SDR family member 12 [Portunus trituberculatus]|uniref:Dehydrogenase/reductase SDR family member 12 n=1 Tax=Portunus trituberculatus TaxID=210409 RepID=A0A5B7CHV4_PORTR|nr:Dehydrogenase/reductase SDR family member 12 [Portunus trituberculatus]
MVNTREVNEAGLEKNFATNTLGTYILTTRLLPLLAKDLYVQYSIRRFHHSFLHSLLILCSMTSVVMTEQWAAQHPEVHFSVMHPGWADTPAVRTSMPEFHAKMKDRLRTPEQGADTAVWLTLSSAALQQPSGLFFQDRQAVATHLPLACTRSDAKDGQQLMATLEELAQKHQA